jgi:hypothetical protein
MLSSERTRGFIEAQSRNYNTLVELGQVMASDVVKIFSFLFLTHQMVEYKTLTEGFF